MQERNPEEHFWERVDRNGPVPAHRPELGPCWPWTRGHFAEGYGAVKWADKTRGTHRVAWMVTYGPIPPRICVLHHCDNRPCCRPDHLFLGTKGDNARDMTAKGRHDRQQRTHCPQGHPYDDANTYWYRDHRYCRTCSSDRRRSGQTTHNSTRASSTAWRA
jgi:hypothetical protein